VNRRTVRLTERKTRAVRLPRADAAFLLDAARNLIDVEPAFERGCYRLTPRGHVGWLDGPTRRFVIRPKLPWLAVLRLLNLEPERHPAGSDVSPEAELLAVLAREFCDHLDTVIRAGLVRGYLEADTESAYLRGRLRTADQLRDAAARAFPDRFHITETVFDLNTPWNRIPKYIAECLARSPTLPQSLRDRVVHTATPLDLVEETAVTDADFTTAFTEPRAAAYHPLLETCRLIHDGFRATDFTHSGGGAFLIDLGRAFEGYVTTKLAVELGRCRSWSLDAQPRFQLTSTAGEPSVLQPDVVIRRAGAARVVLDVKWKRPAAQPDPADLHQVLAYALAAGVPHAVLVYPGDRTSRHELVLSGGRVRVTLFRIRLAGTTDECRRSAARLARVVRSRQ
jgi:5-methylcytosine-specific restriction enzyme subunit McrC